MPKFDFKSYLIISKHKKGIISTKHNFSTKRHHFYKITIFLLNSSLGEANIRQADYNLGYFARRGNARCGELETTRQTTKNTRRGER